jgi:cell division septation protein DedD
VTALPPSGAATPGSTTTPSTTAPSATPATPSATAPSATTPSAATQTPTGTPVAASASAEEASYRVSVGAFGNADNAQRLAQQFQGAGYPVLLGTQGNLTIVLLGPYASDSEARRVADQVDGTFGIVDPTVYRFEPEDGVAATTAPAAPASTTQAAPAAPAATPAAPAAAASGRYLQVGAYANRESSLPQRERLEGIGFTVTEVQEGALLKLLVGPYQGAALSDAQSRLAAEGIENFARGL